MRAAFLEKIKEDFPEYRFRSGQKFAFRPPRTIIIGPDEPHDEWLLLHEIAHAGLGHKDFTMDIERLKMESAAWEKAKKLASRYEMEIDEDFIQNELDTYREWLHKKSRCPDCGLTRFQDTDGYHCPRCENLK